MAKDRSDNVDRERGRHEDARTIREVLVVLGVVAVACLVLMVIVREQAVQVLSVMSGSV